MNTDIILKYLSGELNPEQTQELLKWVSSGYENKKEFARLKNEWTASVINKSLAQSELSIEYKNLISRLESNNKRLSPITKQRKISVGKTHVTNKIMWAAAIILLFYSISISIYFASKSKVTEYNLVTTKRGEKSEILLADGTKIWLNSETTLRYPTNIYKKNTKVFLDGEAYFKVAKVPNRKFVVKTSTIDIAVLGTSFNVKSYSNEQTVQTTLEEGKIAITGTVGKQVIKKPVMLGPNEQAVLQKSYNSVTISQIAKTDEQTTQKQVQENKGTQEESIKTELLINEQIIPELYTSWKDGKLLFKSESFESLAQRMERWYDVKIEIKNNTLKDKKYTGVFEKETIEQALKALSLTLPFNYKIEKNQIIIF